MLTGGAPSKPADALPSRDRAPRPAPRAAASLAITTRDVGPPAQPAAGAKPSSNPSRDTTRAASPAIDSTQTVRPLTPLELADGEASRWFAIQLKVCATAIDATEVPALDIFGQYRLYCVTGLEQDRPVHALRLGFFTSEVAAKAVARYLCPYFPAPAIMRVSIAERERFADRLITAAKDIGASGKHAVIELVGTPQPLPEARTTTAPVQEPKPPDRIAARLWSRLRAARPEADR